MSLCREGQQSVYKNSPWSSTKTASADVSLTTIVSLSYGRFTFGEALCSRIGIGVTKFDGSHAI